MKKTTTMALAVLVSLALASSVWAQCGASAKGDAAKGGDGKAAGCAKTGDKSKADGAACCPGAKTTCPGKEMAATGMPLMTYKIGDETTRCPQTASKMAKGDDSKIRFVVGEKEYDNRSDAMKAYEAVLEDYLSTMTQVKYCVGDQTMTCPKAAESASQDKGRAVKYRVATVAFTDRDQAEKAAEAANKAAEKITMKMVVDGKTYECEKEGAMAAGKMTCPAGAKDGEAKSKECEYVVGDCKTRCAVTAKVELAKARIVAVYQALEQVSQKELASKDGGSGA